MRTIKQDDAIFKALDLKYVSRLICNTDKGPLELCIRKGDTQHFLTLDSVPLDKDVNKEIMDVLFKPEIPQVAKTSKPVRGSALVN